jgi:hypothetical protein
VPGRDGGLKIDWTKPLHNCSAKSQNSSKDRILEDPDTLPGFSTLVGAIFEGL